jgi:hypothetical protein
VQRVLRGTSATVEVEWLDSEGSAVPPPTVTVGVTRANGTVLVPAGTVTAPNGSYTLTPAQTALLDELTLTWTSVDSVRTATVEVVGGFYFSLAQARSVDRSLEDVSRYPTAEVLATRQEVEEEFEAICEVSFVPRFRRAVLRGRVLPDPLVRRIRSVSVGGVAYTAAQVAAVSFDPAGVVNLPTRGEAVIEYEHGWDAPPADLRRAAITRLRSRLNAAKSAIPERATSFSFTEGGGYRLDTPGEHKTGIPDVDAVLERYQHRSPVVA